VTIRLAQMDSDGPMELEFEDDTQLTWRHRLSIAGNSHVLARASREFLKGVRFGSDNRGPGPGSCWCPIFPHCVRHFHNAKCVTTTSFSINRE
jgi:hypothetical protein